MVPVARSVRDPAVAGLFYPSEPPELQSLIATSLEHAREHDALPGLQAIIAPHAGYIYAGVVAAAAYRLLPQRRKPIHRVIVFGPSHCVAFHGAALPGTNWFRTPLGDVPIDTALRESLLSCDGVQILDAAHADEHSVEVQIPFLQTVLAEFELLPVVLGYDGAPVAERLIAECMDEHTFIVISTDLSHFHTYSDARDIDAETACAIERLDGGGIGSDRACGCEGVVAILAHAQQQSWSVFPLDIRNSGDTAGGLDAVVGYGAWALA